MVPSYVGWDHCRTIVPSESDNYFPHDANALVGGIIRNPLRQRGIAAKSLADAAGYESSLL